MKDIKKDPKLLSRFRHFMRSKLNPETVRRQLLSTVQPSSDGNLPEDVVVLVAATAKMFAGDVVEQARELQRDDPGPIRPDMLLEAYRRMRQQDALPFAPTRPVLQ